MTTPSTPGTPARQPVAPTTLDHLVAGEFADPHSVLGPHVYDGGVTVRVLRPTAEAVRVVVAGEEFPLEHEHAGVFSGVLPLPQVPDYRLRVTYAGASVDTDDAYRFLPTLGEVDLHLVGEGRHEQLWEVLGSHVRTYETLTGPVTGTSFAVWAPAARGVRVVGDFNYWDGTASPLRSLGSSGVWELFVPDVGDGSRYKFEILGHDGVWRQKADPMAFATEVPPSTASMVFTSSYEWADSEWMAQRAARRPVSSPMSIYEVHLGSWRRGPEGEFLNYRDLAALLVDYVTEMGFTHVELLPVTEHPFDLSWGYQATGYFAPTSRFGTPDDFRYLVDYCHRHGIGVILDWVPAHFPKDAYALARFDGTALYEHADPRKGEHLDWSTLIFNYGRNEVRNFLLSSALYWLREMHIDGLRVDAVASMLYLDYSRTEWIPNKYGGRENLEAIDFLRELNAVSHAECPGALIIAEESTSWPQVTRPTYLGGLGFDVKWNMGWMNDTLRYMSKEPIHRQYHHDLLTFSMLYCFTENFMLPFSHDEVVHGKGSMLNKMPGDEWQRFANLRTLYTYMFAHPGKKLLFIGTEFGQGLEWNSAGVLDWYVLQYPLHAGMQRLVKDLNGLYRRSSALHGQDFEWPGFEWIDCHDSQQSILSFVRKSGDDFLVVVVNFTPVVRTNYRIGVPRPGGYREVLNSDSEYYGGSNVGNGLGEIAAEHLAWMNRPYSLSITVPPLAAVVLAPSGAPI